MSVYEKLLEVQQQLKAPKGQTNTFGKYKYRSCEDILEAVKPLLGQVKAALMLSDRVELVGDRHYIVATATFVDTESGETIPVTAQAREEREKKGMDASQVTGASSSYARKYALNGLFCIDDTKDSDATNHGREAARDAVRCEDCGAEITEYDDGQNVIPAKAMAKRSKEKYGRVLCVRCGKREQKRVCAAGDGS